MRAIVAFLAVLQGQDPDPAALLLYRKVGEEIRRAPDFEACLRLGRVRDGLRERARTALFGGQADPEKNVLRFHDIRTLVSRVADCPAGDFWEPLVAQADKSRGVTSWVDEPRNPAIGEEVLVDLIRETVVPGAWDDTNTILQIPGGQFLVSAPPAVQRRLAAYIEKLEKEIRREVRATVKVFAFDSPDTPIGDLATLDKRARRVGLLHLSAHLEQLVSATSGRRITLVTSYAEGRPVKEVRRDGFAFEFRAVPSAGAIKVSARIGFRKLLSIEEFPTADGPVDLPRFAETEARIERRVPDGRWVLLDRMGPFPEEAGIPPYLAIVGRFSIDR